MDFIHYPKASLKLVFDHKPPCCIQPTPQTMLHSTSCTFPPCSPLPSAHYLTPHQTILHLLLPLACTPCSVTSFFMPFSLLHPLRPTCPCPAATSPYLTLLPSNLPIPTSSPAQHRYYSLLDRACVPFPHRSTIKDNFQVKKDKSCHQRSQNQRKARRRR